MKPGPGLSEAHRLPAADRGGMGICLSSRGVDQPILRGDGRVAGAVCVVHEELAERGDVAGGQPDEAQRFGTFRHARAMGWSGVRTRIEYYKAGGQRSRVDMEDTNVQLSNNTEPGVAWRLVRQSCVGSCVLLPVSTTRRRTASTSSASVRRGLLPLDFFTALPLPAEGGRNLKKCFYTHVYCTEEVMAGRREHEELVDRWTSAP